MENKNKEQLLLKVDELISIIKETDDYKRYIELKDAMENNKDLMNLIRKIKQEQQIIINKEYHKKNIESDEAILNELKKELYSYPAYQEFSYLQNDLNSTLQSIRAIIENSVKKINS